MHRPGAAGARDPDDQTAVVKPERRLLLDTYSHVMPGMQEEAAEKIDAGLRKALAG